MKTLPLLLFALILSGLPAVGQAVSTDNYAGAYFFPAPDPSTDMAGTSSAHPAAGYEGMGNQEKRRVDRDLSRAATYSLFLSYCLVPYMPSTISARLLHFGAGVEGSLGDCNLGWSVDGGLFRGAGTDSVISVSPGVVYHWTPLGKRSSFLRFGVTMLWNGRHRQSVINLGAGVNCRMSGRWGVRFEVCDNMLPGSLGSHLLEFRTALVIRK
jgi:hypothetical protein